VFEDEWGRGLTESDTRAAIAPPGQRADNASDSALNSLLPHLLKLFRREPALGITVAYLFVAMAGIFYNYRFYAKFHIPVLSLSQISDFLTAGIQQPVALLLVLSTLSVIWLMDAANVWARRRYRRNSERLRALEQRSRWQRLRLIWIDWNLRFKNHLVMQIMYCVIIVSYGWLFVAVYADRQVERVQGGEGAQVKLRLNGSEADLAASTAPAWTWLGAVSNHIFVYDAAAKRALVLPTNNVARIEPISFAGKADAAKTAAPKAESASAVAPNP